MLSTEELAKYISQEAIDATLVHPDGPTPTVEAAAAAVGTRPEQIVKSLLFFVDDNPVLAISCGMDRIDRRCLAAYFGVGRKRVKLAGPKEVEEITGYSVGAVPPFGHAQTLQVFLDPRVLEQQSIFAGGGADNSLLKITSNELQRVTQAVVLDLQSPRK